MKYELKHGQALVLVGPEGCGKSTLARDVAAQYGEYAEMRAEHITSLFRLGQALARGPKTLIVDGTPSGRALCEAKELIVSREVMVERPREAPRAVPTPNFIFCTSDRESLGALNRDRRFRVVDLSAKPHCRHTGEARRATVMAALPGTALQLAERTGMPKSTVYYFLYTSPARRRANTPEVWEAKP